MHMTLVIIAGLLLLLVFILFGYLWGGTPAAMTFAARAFIRVWLGIALVNMWVGVSRAGYTVLQELPILLVVFAVPAAIAFLAMKWVGEG